MRSTTLIEPRQVILASESPQRLNLLRQLRIEPCLVLPTFIDETPLRNESPAALALRLAQDKLSVAIKIINDYNMQLQPQNHSEHRFSSDQVAALSSLDLAQCIVIAADTVVSVGRRLLPKTQSRESASECLRLISGRAHRVWTGVAVAKGELSRSKVAHARIKVKRLSFREIESYLDSQEWQGKAGAYAIQGLAGAFTKSISGSYSAIVGLPLAETYALIAGL